MADRTVMQVLEDLTGHKVTLRPADDYLSIDRVKELPTNTVATLVRWKDTRSPCRDELMAQLWDLARPDPKTPEDRRRCPDCPHRGKGALYKMAGEDVICDCHCPPQERIVYP